MYRIESYSENQTIEEGRKIAARLSIPSVISLEGSLGAGKTVFTKGIALGLEIFEEITSPTFTIISEYMGSVPLYHIDLYRIDSIEEMELLGLEEFLYGKGVSVVEWGEKAATLLPEDTIRITISIEKNGFRCIEIPGLTG